MTIEFPSPYGELHFSITTWLSKESSIEFPSPYGELHFSIKAFPFRELGTTCFRPLTGNYISQ